VAKKTNGERKYLAGTGSTLRLGIRDRVGLVRRSGLLATCLSAIVVVAETDKAEGIRQLSDAGTSGERTYPNFGFW
jgi:hypothetical protein